MTAERFSLDTNVLVYAADRDAGERHERALEIMERSARRPCTLTVQALAEFFHATTGKGIVPKAEAASQVRDWLDLFPTAAAGSDALRVALRAVEDRRFSFWDGMLLATAEAAGCRAVLSEGMEDGAGLGNIVVRDPFKGSGFPPETAALLGASEEKT
ncbi:MAG: PIN domain-containing protein [Rhodospirillales bacterium]|jgi:predicted nucleic acid-binding protein|nr:PIN domain-containing protein [Rhodospirillales bacterium]HIJ42801.1 PIN domain-containing protein [Rhodospirillaceae bacterium]MDP7097723.1 PIN domain-containing protein [Rhodospirillales bacterium]MDP7214777.1 PIN domain-containing protein [Rhodospirillales bacterium]HIJ44719.1 PIN domain-containing protein [Rhodospirillaceae bacterium]